MNKRSFVVGSLLLAVPVMLSAREPKLQNPCKDLRTDLDSQVNNLHKQQDDALAQCRQANAQRQKEINCLLTADDAHREIVGGPGVRCQVVGVKS